MGEEAHVGSTTGICSRLRCGVGCWFALLFCVVIGLVFISLGLTLYLKLPGIANSRLMEKITIEKGHASYKQLEKPTIPIYKDFYFFNFTNAAEFASRNGGVKPVLKEIGPYSYRENRTKTFTDNPGGVDWLTYTQRKIFHFDTDNSAPGVAETDKICTINIPLVAAISDAEKSSQHSRSHLRKIINANEAKVYICQQARALAWNYTDGFLSNLYYAKDFPKPYFNMQINDSIDDRSPSIIHTGVGNVSMIGQFVQWDGLKKLDTWPNGDITGANEIRGTEGFFFRPNLKGGDNLMAFVDDIQRSIDLVYQEKVNPLGLTGFRYGIDDKTFKSAFNEPQNARWGSWCPDGMFYLGPTQIKEIPVFGSKPHFLGGNRLLVDSVHGLKPNRSKHDSFVDVEPNTGTTLNFARRLQINVQVNRTDKRSSLDYPMYELSEVFGCNDSRVLYYPVVYIDEHATMDADFKQILENEGLKEVQISNVTVPIIFGVMLSTGVIVLLISLFLCGCYYVCRSKIHNGYDYTPLVNPSI